MRSIFHTFRPICLLSVALIVAFALPATASLNGLYSTPLGKVKVTERNGVVKARSIGKSKCGKRRQLIFEGTRLDDSITGTIHACKSGPKGCKGKASGMMMLLITRGGKTLSGAVHMNAGKCKTPLKGDGITINLLERAGTTKKIKLKKRGRSATRKEKATRVSSSSQTKNAAPTKSKREEAEAIVGEGAQLLQNGKIEEAREKFTKAVEVAPDYSNAYQGLGVTYYLRGRYAEALDEYKRAIEANPSNGDTYYNMACVYALLEKREQAFRYLSIAVVNGYVDETFSVDEDLVFLRDDPRWEQIKMGLPVQTDPDAAKANGETDSEKGSQDGPEGAADASAAGDDAPESGDEQPNDASRSSTAKADDAKTGAAAEPSSGAP